MSWIFAVLIGALAGAHASTWGMYKDAPHEGFSAGKYLRSILLGAFAAVPVAAGFGIVPASPGSAVILFGCVYAIERAVLEAWKTFFREEDQSKYTIPMQIAVLGRPVQGRAIRLGLGLLYVGVMAGGIWLVSQLDGLSRMPVLVKAVTVGALGGWFSAFGGAWKDAPIEGFQILKFFRSPLIASGWAFLLYGLGATPVQGMLGAIGYTVATTETWKTFFFPAKPRGKFAGKPVLFPEMLRKRLRFVPLYVAVWLGVVAGFVVALGSR
ncbi:MAG: hypothetical protein ACT4PM_13960 [Gemmatimonadales bacterium]